MSQPSVLRGGGGNFGVVTSMTVRLHPIPVVCTGRLSAINLHHFRGAAARIPLAATPFGLRQPHFMAEILASWSPVADGAQVQAPGLARVLRSASQKICNPKSIVIGVLRT